VNKLQHKKKTVFVGLSGGVDSSVTAYLLQKEGYDVVGVYLKTWQPEWVTCTWRDEKRDAMRVSAHLGIPFVFIDVAEEYRKGVAEQMIKEYRAGKVPNPDVLCNRDIKFGIFLREALRRGADMIATGHYARVVETTQEFSKENSLQPTSYKLLTGIDESKDQAYFLWMLTQKELAKTLFPLGGLKKTEVRKIAAKAGLTTAEKKDSQGICFIGDIDMKTFLSHYIPEKEGSVLDEHGVVIGKHTGAHFYTIGERHGFTLFSQTTEQPSLYVVSKDIEKNTITVSAENPFTRKNNPKDMSCSLTECNFLAPLSKKEYLVEARYHGKRGLAEIVVEKDNHAHVVLKESIGPLIPGQSLVIYDGDQCLGGGVIV
jgi:tRNA-specific 2-thiouridylase